ncbi:ATP-binding cassette domain-containing protein [Clostridia bacterium]|nr:ATP-binding cassette domain-containing protein [Clostridia bacterium]
MGTIIEAKDFSYNYPRRENQVLKDLNFKVEEGEFIAIMGRNGAGKSTLCQALDGVIPHLHGGSVWGNIVIDGLDTQDVEVATMAQKIGIVLEDPEAQLFTTRVDDEIAFGIENLCLPREEIIERIKWATKVVRLEGYGDREPTALSGGQKQRCAIAATLAMKPKIMVLDEPTSQLDPIGTYEVFDVIKSLKEEYGMTVLVTTHKSEHIAQYADKIMVLEDGKIVAFDTPQAIFRNSELLEHVAVRPPQVSLLASYLNSKGQHIERTDYPILIEEAEALIRKLTGGASNGQ